MPSRAQRVNTAGAARKASKRQWDAALPSRLIGLAALVLGLSSVFAPPTWGRERPDSAVVCPAGGVNPYAASIPTLEACHDSIIPQTALHQLGNGAIESVYGKPGSRVRFITPPPSFRASTATRAELELYGIPTEPARTSPEYPKWRAMIAKGVHITLPPPYLVEGYNSPTGRLQLTHAAEYAHDTSRHLNPGWPNRRLQ
jgi:hypothetical protein